FGAETPGTVEPGRTVFESYPPPPDPTDPGGPAVYAVGFRIAPANGPVTITGFRLYELADGAVEGGTRGVSAVHFMRGLDVIPIGGPANPADDGSANTYTFGPREITAATNLEIVLFANADGSGPRIVEL